jgi:hypothetical protein
MTAPARPQGLLDSRGHLLGEALLHLQSARVHLQKTWELAEPHHTAGRQVRDVGLAEERKHVVLAERVELDILHEDHLIVIFGEDGTVQDVCRGLGGAGRQEREGLGHTLRGLEEAFPQRVLADGVQKSRDGPFHGALRRGRPEFEIVQQRRKRRR